MSTMSDPERLREIEQDANSRIYEIHSNARMAEDHVREVVRHIRNTTERYYKYGMCVIPDFLHSTWGSASYVGGGTPRGYFKDLAAAWQRPFVCAERYMTSRGATDWWEVSLPKSKRSDKLAVSLMLAATETTEFSGGGRGWRLSYDTIYQDSTNGTWKFYVNDRNYSFIEQYEYHCATDPICRIILNLAGIPRP
jgi:hypothetical protein